MKGKNKMFNWLQNKLGITDLQQKIEQQHQEHQLHWQVVTEQWKQTTLRLSSIDDQWLEMKERVKALEGKISEPPTPSVVSAWHLGNMNPSVSKAKQTIQQKVLTCLTGSKRKGMHYSIIAQSLGRNKTEICAILAKMIRKGIVVKLKPGVYALTPLKDTLHDPQ
jgi:hypothetical protein